jgi:hypothetical protein
MNWPEIAALIIVVPPIGLFILITTRTRHEFSVRRESLRSAAMWHRDCRRDKDEVMLATAEKFRLFLSDSEPRP